jgi:hypothetical protein
METGAKSAKAVAQGEQQNAEGNAAFQAGHFKDAFIHYHKAIQADPGRHSSEVSDQSSERCPSVTTDSQDAVESSLNRISTSCQHCLGARHRGPLRENV